MDKSKSNVEKKNKYSGLVLGLIFTIFSAAITFIVCGDFFSDPRLEPSAFDAGVDTLGSVVCVALFYGCMKQKGEGVIYFRSLIVLVSASFMVNILLCYSAFLPEITWICFTFCLISKFLNLAIITLFYLYVKVTLNLKGKLTTLVEKAIPILIMLEVLLLVADIFYPVTFQVDATGNYLKTDLFLLEHVYFTFAAIFTTILIFKSDAPKNQKSAALTFVIMPIIEYLAFYDSLANSGMYGVVLMSLVVMYCIIFNDKITKLAATETELNMAKDIQTSMLPVLFPAFPNRKEFDLHASMDPAKEVGGDFYDFFLIDDDHLGMAIADVSGKGVPAALFMMSSKILLDVHSNMGGTPSEILERVNKTINSTNKAHMFVTMWLGILEISTGKLTTSSAGHEFPIINVNGKYEIYKDQHGLPVGAFPISKYTNHEIQLKKGDSVFVYTDGVAEAADANTEFFGVERTLDALNSMPKDSSQKEVLLGVRSAVDAFVKDAPQFDDLTMLGIKYYGPEGKDE